MWGAATAVYVDGVLNPGGVLHTMDNATGLFWRAATPVRACTILSRVPSFLTQRPPPPRPTRRLMPLLAFSLITGLGLDYDIFLLTSITEERAAGWGDEDAVALGVMRSGPIISYAGLCAGGKLARALSPQPFGSHRPRRTPFLRPFSASWPSPIQGSSFRTSPC